MRLRCPVGAVVAAFKEDEPLQVDDENRCGHICPITTHPTLQKTAVLVCPKHGEMLVNEELWAPQVTE